ncbi:histidine kinase [Nocardioides sp. Soil774]|uniref:sensor histidine kinase n=1 Tax=Nocardioides sp. Soil774 TaxID=1736408 RepID=UPI0006FB03FC|nr:HAMP domain-containing sensor histidine kinase [Nocardioides sp. Soil774]KRE94310.1 histidine kinase [Nocardioides sp. Soil774]
MNLGERLRTLPLRRRLVAGFAAAMLVLLTAAGAVVYWRVQYALDRGLDTELRSARAVIIPLVDAAGHVTSPEAADATGTGWQVLGADGSVLDSGGAAPGRTLVPDSALPATGSRTLDVGSMLPIAAAPYRVEVTVLGATDGAASYVLVGVRRDHRDEALRELLLQMSLAGVGALVVASLVGDQLARLALRPVERYRRRASEIASGSGHRRLEVPTRRDDEVTRLGHTLNEMLGALEESLTRERQFVGDASHELRTPLTLLRTRIQLARRRERSVAEHEAVLDELAVDVARLADLAEQLLELDRTSSSHGSSGDLVDLGEVVAAEVGRWRAAHPDRADGVVVDEPDARVHAAVGRQALERIVTNLLANALAHGSAPVRVVVRREGGHAVLQVADEGPGMDPDMLAQATRRFSRAPEARARPGAGLGLSLVEHLAVSAGGELRLCHAGHHASTGVAADVECLHDDRMTATVLLPVAPARNAFTKSSSSDS